MKISYWNTLPITCFEGFCGNFRPTGYVSTSQTIGEYVKQ